MIRNGQLLQIQRSEYSRNILPHAKALASTHGLENTGEADIAVAKGQRGNASECQEGLDDAEI